MSDRITSLRALALASRQTGDPDGGRLHRESFAQTEGEPAVIREAKAIAHYYRNQAVIIRDGELLVGTSPGLKADPNGPVTPAIFGRQGFTPFWTVPDLVRLFFAEGMLCQAGNHTTLHYETVLSIGFRGLIGRVEERLARLAADEPGAQEKRHFLSALQIVAGGYIDLSDRYADAALEFSARPLSASGEGGGGEVPHGAAPHPPTPLPTSGEGERERRTQERPRQGIPPQERGDERRRRELETIAQNCRRVPAGPPSTFWEACQSVWFSFFFLPDAPGRVDQYLYPFYRRDMENGTLTRDFAKELLSCLWLKYFESVGATSGVSAHNHLTLGGVRPDGSDASNEVTHLCLEVTEELAVLRPQVGVRWNRNAPPELLRRAVRTLRARTGNPDLCSDEQIVPALVSVGVSLEDARDFSLSGCHEVIVTGKAQMGSVEGFVNLPKILRMALGLEPALQEFPPEGFNTFGRVPVGRPVPGRGDQRGLSRCGDPSSLAGGLNTLPKVLEPSGGHQEADLSSVTTYEALWERLVGSMDIVAQSAHEASLCRDLLAASHPGGDLRASLVTHDCIEKARGYTQGGARYNFCNWDVIGIANLADSLAAIRALVFEEQALSLDELAHILASDWSGQEPLRRRVLNALPHFGNDDPAVDSIAAQVIETFSAVLKRRKPFRGGEYILGTTAGGENMHIEFGRKTGATPDGRRAGETLADSLGAAQGRDRHGVTALLNSVARLPHRLLPTATTLNVKLDPKLIETEAGIDNIAALIQAHFLSGGQQVQFNLVNREMLLEAKRCPEKHTGLMVRVAGYSAPFTSLWSDLQDEIIARTEHGL